MSGDEIVEGALIQGAGGEVYFIPADELAEFRLPDDLAQRAESEFLSQVEDEVSGFAFDPTYSPMEPKMTSFGEVSMPKAYYGPIGKRQAAMGPTDKTVVNYQSFSG
jgi:hypothetical protein